MLITCFFRYIFANIVVGDNMQIYNRENYLNKIRGFYDDTETIKVITGIRRCGKSTLLESIKSELKQKGIKDENIIDIKLDKRP